MSEHDIEQQSPVFDEVRAEAKRIKRATAISTDDKEDVLSYAREVVNLRAELAAEKEARERAEAEQENWKAQDLVEQNRAIQYAARARAAEVELEAAKGALKFYADPPNSEDVTVPDFYDELNFGALARATLAILGDD